MALDKQRILSELGSVVNQLQSVDCGCMSKLFNNGAEAPNAGYRRACCGGHRTCAPCAGEPQTRMPCGGCCNPPKLYSDTYNYLTNNVMQPTMKEVYEDLKSLNPTNTIMNDSFLPPNSGQQNMAMVPGTGGNAGGHPAQMLGQMANMNNNSRIMNNGLPTVGNTMPNAGQNNSAGAMMNSMPTVNSVNNAMQNPNMGNMMNSGMGPQIAKMMMGGGRGKPQSNGVNDGNQQSVPMNESNLAHGPAGVNQLNPHTNKGQYIENNLGQNMAQNPLVHYPMQMAGRLPAPGDNLINTQNTIGGSPIQSTNPMGGIPSSLQRTNMPYQNVGSLKVSGQEQSHGIHSAGIKKFNEIFPGVMQGDLGFDPMAIAVQMNPANKQQAAMDTMRNLVMEKNDPRRIMRKQSVPQKQFIQDNMMQQDPGNQQGVPPTPTEATNLQMPTNQIPIQNQFAPNQSQQLYASNNIQQYPTGAGALQQPQQLQLQSTNQIPIQNESQVYPVNTVQQQQLLQQPQMAQLQEQQGQQKPLQQQGKEQPLQQLTILQQQQALIQQQKILQQQIDKLQASQKEQYGSLAPEEPVQEQNNKFYKEPILPSDNTSNIRNSFIPQVGYNTLGQPVQYVSPELYRKSEPKLPQTLSPHESLRIANKRYSKVKLTESRTSIVGNNMDGKTPSRNTLQNMYNQYKGSHSFTQQNVSNVVRGGTVSDGKLKVAQEGAQSPQVHVERVGGDTLLNTQNIVGDAVNNQPVLLNSGEQIGDVTVKEDEGKPIRDPSGNPDPYYPNVRNGIQDIVHASANAQAPSWSFHGEVQTRYYRPRPRPRKYRYY